MKDLIRFVLVSAMFSFISCSDKKEKAAASDVEFRYYNLESQGWKSKLHAEKIDGIRFTATEVPIQYYILKEMGSSDLNSVDSVYEANKRERIIEFTFENEDEKDLLKEEFTNMDYESGVKYMSFTIEKDFYAVTSSKDTIKCSGVMFERNFKAAPFNKILLFFTNVKPDDKIQLVYDDKLFRKGTLKFNFTDQLLNL